jgi:hypothetical protein
MSAQDVDTLGGVYACEGTNPDGRSYHGTVVITRHGDTVQVGWMARTGLAAVGFGIVRDGVLAVSFYGAAPGVAAYRIDGERLVGQWTQPGANGLVFFETLTKLRSGTSVPAPTSPTSAGREVAA